MRIKISVIIPTWKRTTILRKVIDSLILQKFPKEHFEVIICDSFSEDGTLELVQSYVNKLNIRLINTEINAQSVKRNIGAERARGDILVFLDDDVIPSENLLNGYFKAHQNSKNIVFLGLSLFSNESEKNSNFIRYRNDRTKKIMYYKKDIPAENFVSMNFSIKKLDFFKIGMFDDTFTNYGGEDHDFPIRMEKMEYYSKLCIDAKSEHREPDSNLLNRMKKIFVSSNKGFIPLKSKYPSFFKNSKIGLLEQIDKADTNKMRLFKTIINIFLSSLMIKIVAHFLCWSDSYRIFYFPKLYRIVFAYAYIEGVRMRSLKIDSNPEFFNWEFWSNYI